MKKTKVLLFLIVICYSGLQADSLTLSFYQNSTDNLFQNVYAQNDMVSSFSFSLNKDFSGISLFTQGNLFYLYENPQLTYYAQDLGIDYVHPTSEKTAWYFALTGRSAFYRADYSDFNYTALNFFTALKSYLSPTSILKLDYTLEYKNYAYSLFNFLSNNLHFSIDKFLPSKTTLKAEINLGYKYFLDPFLEEGSESNNNASQTGTAYYFGKGKGPGTGQTQNTPLFLTSPETGGQGIANISLGGLVAQGIGDYVGVSFSGMRQWPLAGENPFTYIDEFYMVENPTYDRFAWGGYQLNTELSILLPWNMQAKLGYNIAIKQFPGIESLDLEGNPLEALRKDNRKLFEARLEKHFRRFNLYLSYRYINNHSNDQLFDWQGNYLAAGIEWNIFLGER